VVTLTAEESFRRLVDSVTDYAIFMLDPRGHVMSWNEGARRIKGYEPSEIIGRHFSIFYRAEDVAARVCDRELEMAARDGHFEGWRIRKDGSAFWANVVITPLRNERGELVGYAKVTRDLTDRSYRTFIEATHATVWTCDRDGVPNADSPTWRALTGQTVDEWRSQDAFDPIEADDRVRLEAALQSASRFDLDVRLRHRDGAERWMRVRAVPMFDSGGALREWFCAGIDISEQKSIEREREHVLRRAERARAELATTLVSIGDAVITTNAVGLVTFMNPVAERLTQWPAARAGEQPFGDIFPLVHEQTHQPAADPVARVLREGVVVTLADHLALKRSDGSSLPILGSASPIRAASGELYGVVMVFHDVSAERREAERRAFLLRVGEALMGASNERDALQAMTRLTVPRFADLSGVALTEPGGTLNVVEVAHVDPAMQRASYEHARDFVPKTYGEHGVVHVIRTGAPSFNARPTRRTSMSSRVDPSTDVAWTPLDFAR
jgi:PAS domain S-box-containing protein